MDFHIEIREDPHDVVIDPQNELEAKNNLLKLLGAKRNSLQIAADCHYYLFSRYTRLGKLIDYTGLALIAASFILSTILGDEKTTVNIPWTVTTGVSMILNGSKQIMDYVAEANAHDVCYKAALDLSDDIEYELLKNNHTKEGLQHSLEIYEDRIKSFRKIEKPIPFNIKQKFIPSTN